MSCERERSNSIGFFLFRQTFLLEYHFSPQNLKDKIRLKIFRIHRILKDSLKIEKSREDTQTHSLVSHLHLFFLFFILRKTTHRPLGGEARVWRRCHITGPMSRRIFHSKWFLGPRENDLGRILRRELPGYISNNRNPTDER